MLTLAPATLFKKKFWHWCFPVNFAKFSRTPALRQEVFVISRFRSKIRKIKMPPKIYFSLNRREIMLQNKVSQPKHEIKMS